MASFTAVVTTGIYCRPGCAARTPKPGNTRPFSTAAAAEAAGFRACLRCRPYREAPVVERGPELVCQAIRLIHRGALDGGTEQQLGETLGVSGRHLRRLFLEHLGCTPDQLARSTRAHFARRLLDDTDLPLGELAFACGYGSVRQMSRDLRVIFRANATELRARRRKADRLIADGGLCLRLPFQPPLAWPAMLEHLRRRAIPGVEHVTETAYLRTIVIDGDPGALELHSPDPHGPDPQSPDSQSPDRRSSDPGVLLLRLHLPHWAELLHITGRARSIFALDGDYASAQRHLQDHPLIGPLMLAQPGLRPPGTWDPFETAVTEILGCQERAGMLVSRFGTPVPGLSQLGLTHTFPSPAALADADLRDIGCDPDQAKAVQVLAHTAAELTAEADIREVLPEMLAQLAAQPGLSPHTASYVAMRAGERDAYPCARPAEESWRPFRAYAAAYLEA
jgi:AraC family transcriptional regulator, regulatory protein of adaptative response / DNA-3-methyladenine glycosylase II